MSAGRNKHAKSRDRKRKVATAMLKRKATRLAQLERIKEKKHRDRTLRWKQNYMAWHNRRLDKMRGSISRIEFAKILTKLGIRLPS